MSYQDGRRPTGASGPKDMRREDFSPTLSQPPHEDGRRKVTGSAARREEAGRLRVDTTEGVTRCVLINGTAVTRRVKAGTRAFPINPHDAPTQMLLLPSHT